MFLYLIPIFPKFLKFWCVDFGLSLIENVSTDNGCRIETKTKNWWHFQSKVEICVLQFFFTEFWLPLLCDTIWLNTDISVYDCKDTYLYGFKNWSHKRNKKTIYNQFVFENTKITCHFCHADKLTYLYMQEKSSNLLIWTAKVCTFLIWWTHCHLSFYTDMCCIQNMSYSKYCIGFCMYKCQL